MVCFAYVHVALVPVLVGLSCHFNKIIQEPPQFQMARDRSFSVYEHIFSMWFCYFEPQNINNLYISQMVLK